MATHDKDDVLAYADQMMVLHKGEVMRTDLPSAIYSNPEHPLIAAFFGEYSTIEGELYYAHQIVLTDKSSLKAVVKHSFYKGNYFLIEASLNEDVIYFKNPTAVEENSVVSLTLKR